MIEWIIQNWETVFLIIIGPVIVYGAKLTRR